MMNLKKCFLTAAFLIAACAVWCGVAIADPGGFSLTLGYGAASDHIDVYRLGVRKDLGARWLTTRAGHLSGFFELSYNRWEYGSQTINGLALSPVLVWHFPTLFDAVRPYAAAGIGGTLLDDDRIRGRDLGGRFQFEDRIGLGARMGSFDLNLSYFHYSNAGIHPPNDGMDIWMVTAGVGF